MVPIPEPHADFLDRPMREKARMPDDLNSQMPSLYQIIMPAMA
jgi:hypothetical protein